MTPHHIRFDGALNSELSCAPYLEIKPVLVFQFGEMSICSLYLGSFGKCFSIKDLEVPWVVMWSSQ